MLFIISYYWFATCFKIVECLALIIICNILVDKVDRDTLITVLATTPGPDCLKELVPKIGVRIKLYKCIKE